MVLISGILSLQWFTTSNVPALKARIPLTVDVTVIKKIQRRQANIISYQLLSDLVSLWTRNFFWSRFVSTAFKFAEIQPNWQETDGTEPKVTLLFLLASLHVFFRLWKSNWRIQLTPYELYIKIGGSLKTVSTI